jgi:hypothetical protein
LQQLAKRPPGTGLGKQGSQTAPGRRAGQAESAVAGKGAFLYNRAVPTVLRTGPYRFYFFSHEPNEPPHMHVDREDSSAKFWLQPASLARNFGFAPPELKRIQSFVEEHQEEFLEAWNGYFGTGG